jgi:hypothetical protein
VSPLWTDGTAARKRSMLTAGRPQGAGQFLSNPSRQDLQAFCIHIAQEDKAQQLGLARIQNGVPVTGAAFQVKSGDIHMNSQD